mgnify:CR=1 FL=1
MHPILIEIGNFPIHSYGVLIAIGFILCIWVSMREATRLGLPAARIVDLGIQSLFVGMLGARILFILTRLDYFREYPLEMFYVWEGGLVFYGGPILAFPYLIYFCKKHALPLLKIVDIAAVALPLAHAIGRLGCFAAGCCHGHATTMPWGISLNSDLVERHLRGFSIHPTQLYESLSLFGLFFFLRARRRRVKFDGELAVIYVFAYSIIRCIVEAFRGDSIRGFLIEGILSTSQFIAILTALAAFVFWLRLRHGKQETTK